MIIYIDQSTILLTNKYQYYIINVIFKNALFFICNPSRLLSVNVLSETNNRPTGDA